MATVFPLTTYPLSDNTNFMDDHTVARDLLDDGEMRIRQIGTDTFELLRLVFAPLDAATTAVFQTYLRTNKTTEFEITYQSVTYTGYLWSEVRVRPLDAILTTVSVAFRGKVS